MNDELNFSHRTRILIGLIVVTLATFWAYRNLDQGWFPHDEGQLGQAAERVLAGEVPHRDFDDMYTGGLSALNALSFHWWGVSSLSMRWMLLIFFVPFVIGVYWIALHFARPVAAGLVALLAAAWSIPMYSASMPSWYNLFFATWCLCAMLQFVKTGGRAYLLLAGLMIGLSLTFKISGLFVLAGVLLFLLYRNQLERNQQVQSPNSRWSFVFSVLISVALLLASGLSLAFANQHDPVMQAVHLVIPFAALCVFVLVHEWKVAEVAKGVKTFGPQQGDAETLREFRYENDAETLREFRYGKSSRSCAGAWGRLRSLIGDLNPLAIGVAIPLAMLLLCFYRADALGDLIHGALVMPKQRMEFAWAPFPQWKNIVYALPILLLLFPAVAGGLFRSRREQPFLIAAMVVGFLILNLQHTPLGYTLGFQSVRNFSPLLVIGNLIFLLRFSTHLSDQQKQQFFLVTAVAFFVSLIQFPFAVPIYWFYAAPLFLLAALATAHFQNWVPRKTLLTLVVFLILFAVTRYHNPLPNISLVAGYPFRPATAWLDGQTQLLGTDTARLKTARSNLLIDSRVANVYNQLQVVIAGHTKQGGTIFATPDAPEVSFLTGRKSLNGVMYEFFHEDLYADPLSLKSELESAKVNLVAIKETPEFSPVVSQAFRETVLEDFELIETIHFEIDANEKTPMFRVYVRR